MKLSAIFVFVVFCLGGRFLPCSGMALFRDLLHGLEEPENVEIALKTTQGTPKFGNSFAGATLELEYGARGLVDHRSLFERPAHFERQHGFHGI